jgi:hypothetical protein
MILLRLDGDLGEMSAAVSIQRCIQTYHADPRKARARSVRCPCSALRRDAEQLHDELHASSYSRSDRGDLALSQRENHYDSKLVRHYKGSVLFPLTSLYFTYLCRNLFLKLPCLKASARACR